MSAASGDFAKRRVLAFESRRGEDLRAMIASRNGVPYIVPALELRPRGGDRETTAFADALDRGQLTVAVFLTGVGTHLLAAAVEPVLPRAEFASRLNSVAVFARGPKSFAALRALGVSAAIQVPAPHTSRQVLESIDANMPNLRGCRVAVQEYGEPASELLAGLRERGAIALAVPVYEWGLPADGRQLLDAITAIIEGSVDLLLFTAAVQVDHLFRVAVANDVADLLRRALNLSCIASIGPTTSDGLRAHGVMPDVQPNRSNMGLLVAEAATRTSTILERKRQGGLGQ